MIASQHLADDDSRIATTAPPPTFINFLLDETGSMQSCKQATIDGYSDYIASLRDGNACYVTLAKFDSTGIRTPYIDLAVEMIPRLTFYPGQMTNLYDCIGDRLSQTLDQAQSGKSLFVIMTDGQDNHSRTHTISSAHDLIVRAQDSGIVVVFLGPSDTALDIGAKLGIPAGNIKSFRTDKMRETMADLTSATTAFRAGTTSDTKFFSGAK